LGVVSDGRAPVREQFADGPRPESQIEAPAEATKIPERTLIVAASVLGVRTRRGQWGHINSKWLFLLMNYRHSPA
jgi:hypothetical protein